MSSSQAPAPAPPSQPAPHGSTALRIRHAARDLAGAKGTTAALGALLVLSAFLMATGALTMERIVRSVDQLFAEALPPHFLQMHKGDYDVAALEEFAAAHPEIDAWLIEDMLGFDGAALSWQRPGTDEHGDLSDSLIDNLFVSQNSEFDFLLDAAGGIPQPEQGEVYVPVEYQQSLGLRQGDVLRIHTDSGIHELGVEGFVRDAQMASSMASSTRFLVSPADLEALGVAGGGIPEIIVEYRITDTSAVSAFSRAYASDPALPSNGQDVTYSMVRLLNALGSGLMAISLMLVSLALVAIALLSVRLVIRASLEDDAREIGAMKAIGIPDAAIRRLYFTRFGVLTLGACVVGGTLAVGATALLMRSVTARYATAPVDVWTVAWPALALALVALIVLATCRRVLGRIRRIQIVDALVHGSTLDERATARRARRSRSTGRSGSSLAGYRGRRVSQRLALLDLRADGRHWVLIPVVFMLVAMLTALPTNLLTTLSSPQVLTYFGSPDSDVRVDVQFSDDVDGVRQDVLTAIEGDARLADVRTFATVRYEVLGTEGWEALRVDVGETAGDAIAFVAGDQPGPGEIALSHLNSQEYGVETGDELTVRDENGTRDVVVSGVYQDVTSGGRTAKMTGDVSNGAEAYTIFADAADGADPADIAADLGARFPGVTVVPTQEFAQQTLSYATGALRTVTILAYAFGAAVAILLTSLFLDLRLARERPVRAILAAIGFSRGEIAAQTRLKTLVAAAAGTVLGVALAATAGEYLAGGLISATGLGIVELTFIPNPWLTYVALPVALVAAALLTAVVITSRRRSADSSSWLAE